jgi:hypothetical protein
MTYGYYAIAIRHEWRVGNTMKVSLPCNIDYTATSCFSLNLKVYLSSKFAKAQSFSMFVLSILQTEVTEVTNAHTR